MIPLLYHIEVKDGKIQHPMA